jgi:uncharacterized membrane protein YkvA (DUF1232 family)
VAKASWRQRAEAVRRDAFALYLASRDRRVPWFAKAVAVLVVAYALSPIDLIPDFIPVLGYLDDLIIVPAGLLLVRRLIPAEVFAEHRERAAERLAAGDALGRAGAVIVIVVWALVLAVVAWAALRFMA